MMLTCHHCLEVESVAFSPDFSGALATIGMQSLDARNKSGT
jgi:hypothetical protein